MVWKMEESSDPSEDALLDQLRRKRIAWRIALGLALFAAAFGGWWQFLRRPSPEAVCEHLKEVAGEGPPIDYRLWIDPISFNGEASPKSPDFQEQCEWYFGVRKKTGVLDYGKRARCVMRMKEARGIIRCDPV